MQLTKLMRPLTQTAYTYRLQRPLFRASQVPLRAPLVHTMSSTTNPPPSDSPTTNDISNTTKDPTQDTNTAAQPQSPLLPLPSPSTDNSTPTTQIDMSTGGSTVKLDHMGPLVVNKDGSLSRINNWGEMSEIEKKNTLRVLGKRNMLRREALLASEKEGGEGK